MPNPPTPASGKLTYIIYDSRAESGDTDDASVYETCDTLKEARRAVKESWPDGIIFEYDLITNPDGKKEAINERRVW